MEDFVNLRVHTDYSLKESVLKTEQLIEKAKELGQKAVAITDRNNLYGAYEFIEEAKENGLQAIVGCDINTSPNDSIILLCKDTQGYQNLMNLVSYANTEGRKQGSPCISMEVLRQYHEGLVCLSGDEIEHTFLQQGYNGAKAKAEEYKKIFGNDYYIELQCYSDNDIAKVNMLNSVARETGTETVATSDCRYATEKDSIAYHYLNCIRKDIPYQQENFGEKENYIKSAEQLHDILKSSVANTVAIAEKCASEIQFDKSIKIPHFNTGSKMDNAEYLKRMSYKGLQLRYGKNIPEEYKKRLDMELDVIHNKQFDDYFLIVWDFVKFARDSEIPVGLGRGSGAGSLVAYCMGITDVDPMKHNLLFERFLNPERVSMPDFDIDISKRQKQIVKDYVTFTYGAENVCDFSTFTYFQARNTLNALSKVIGSEYDETIKKITDCIPESKKKISELLKDTTEETQAFRNLCRTDKKAYTIVNLAGRLEGIPCNVSTHPAGVIISNSSIKNYTPFRSDSTAQFTKETLEDMGLLKMDFLSLNFLDIINDTVQNIKKTNPDFDIKKIPLDDKATFDLLSKGDTTGVFQLESKGMKNLFCRMKPENIDDVITAISLYRPPTIPFINDYIRNRNSEHIRYPHPALEPILKETNGIILYQEQVMEIFKQLAGYSYGEADTVRKAISKKKPEIMLREHDKFISGAVENGIDKQSAENIFSLLEQFTSYSFNKSHATAYAYTAYQTAFLKANYRELYMSALIENTDDKQKRELYNSDCTNSEIKMRSVDINSSGIGYSSSEHSIFKGLDSVVSSSVASQVINEREKNGDFFDMVDYCERVDGEALSVPNVKKLISAGAFDSCGQDKQLLLDNASDVIEAVHTVNSYSRSGHSEFIFDIDNPALD